MIAFQARQKSFLDEVSFPALLLVATLDDDQRLGCDVRLECSFDLPLLRRIVQARPKASAIAILAQFLAWMLSVHFPPLISNTSLSYSAAVIPAVASRDHADAVAGAGQWACRRRSVGRDAISAPFP
jgi:hypothetical protein